MGRSSSSSCLKIIACGGRDAADNDDLNPTEAKVSSDKRGWSFRKRSGRHRVLGNNVSSETPTSAGKETPQGVNSEFQSPIKPASIDEKSQLTKPVEKHAEPVSTIEHDNESKTSAVVVTSENGNNEKYTESKIDPPVIAPEDSTERAPVESKPTIASIVLENDNTTTVAEPEIANTIVNSEAECSAESAESKINESAIDSESVADDGVIRDEPAAIIIQSAIRGFLARREFVKLKSTIKLQAAARGYLVRKNAVETLHCIRAIVKVQAFVRSRSSKCLDQKTDSNSTKFSSVKLLKNSFARQLLESTPKPKSVSIKCDPLKPNSAWGWLERWMAVSTSEVAQKSEPALEQEDDGQVKKSAAQDDAEDLPIVRFYSVNSKFVTDELPREVETEENTSVQDVSVTDNQSSYPLSKEDDDAPVQESAVPADAEDSSIIRFYSVKSKFITDEVAESLENEENEAADDVNAESVENGENHVVDDKNAVDLGSCVPSTEEESQEVTPQEEEPAQEEVAPVTLDAVAPEFSPSQTDPISHIESEEPKLSAKRSASEELEEGEAKKAMYVSRKASNPAFIAAHSKFEELSSGSNSERAVSLSPRDTGAKSHDDTTASSMQELTEETYEPTSVEITAPSDHPKIHIAGSECGTELSVSSTLDSPDRSDVGIINTEAHQGSKLSEETSRDPANTIVGSDGETHGISEHIETDLSFVSVQQEEVHINDDAPKNPDEIEVSPQPEEKVEITSSDLQTDMEPANSTTPEDSSVEPKQEQNGHDLPLENDSGTEEHKAEHKAHKFSPEASPNSHMTVSESQETTPSSQVSVKSKRNKTDKDKPGSRVKRSTLSPGKNSPSKPRLESGIRSSTENLPKDHKTGKRRNSFGSSKSESADQEPRDSTSHNPLPSYMQATESARAKAHSPRSSPDVHDKEFQLKKRHSLPGATGRQGSPHIQRTSSQVAQGAKANGSNERKWQR